MTFHWATFIFQAVNFLVLVAILWKVLWTPLRRHMKNRADRIAAGLAELGAGREEIAKLKEETQTLLKAARTAKADALRQAEIEANTRQAELLETARRGAARERERLLAQVAGEQQRREREFLRSLSPLIGRLLERLLLELHGLNLHESVSERFADWLDTMPMEERARLSGAMRDGRQFELASASAELPSRVQDAIRSLLSVDGLPTIQVAPQLLAGVRLRVAETVIDGSLRAQIDRAMQELSPAGEIP